MLTASQLQLIRQAELDFSSFTEPQFIAFINGVDLSTVSDQVLLGFLQIANALYRGGEPILTDQAYDTYHAEYKKRQPDDDYLQTVEPEPLFAGKTVDLPAPMLSTDKAYSFAEVQRWLERIEKAAQAIGKDPAILLYRVTPKLDGYAAYDDGQVLYTRGDGRKGTDISRVFARGLQVANHGQRGLGAGEIVINRQYFDQHLADFFDNPRNFQASIIKEKDLDSYAEQAIQDQAAVFFPFVLLPNWQGQADELIDQFDSIVEKLWHFDYDTDGVVLEVTDSELQKYMGATRHHHRWQLAFKKNHDSAEVLVLSVTPQTSRSGRITPVVELEPIRLSGALLSRATAHHYGMVLEKKIGTGAIIELVRSGEVIPKIERVIKPASPVEPEQCPSCGHGLVWDNDYLLCPNNLLCPAQISNSMEHFFRVLKNNDGFGSATIKKLYESGIRRVDEIYALDQETFVSMGFGPKQSENLVAQLIRSRTEAIPDWRFLAAFGVFRMGLGNCERLLSHYAINAIFDLSETDIIAIEGFAEKTAAVITEGFKTIKPLYDNLIALGFNLESSLDQQTEQDQPLAGKSLVFTGTLLSGTRDELSQKAKLRGAKVGSSVSAKTSYLVIGEQVGANKIAAATAKGVTIITEAEFLTLLNGGESL